MPNETLRMKNPTAYWKDYSEESRRLRRLGDLAYAIARDSVIVAQAVTFNSVGMRVINANGAVVQLFFQRTTRGRTFYVVTCARGGDDRPPLPARDRYTERRRAFRHILRSWTEAVGDFMNLVEEAEG